MNKKGFMIREFLTQEGKGKIEIKNYRADHHELRNFDENFIIFGQVGLLK
jgi:hypothetical protein